MKNKISDGSGPVFGGKIKINNQLLVSFRMLSRIFAALVFLTGLLALCGWHFGFEILKRISPNFPVIAPNTALFFAVIGLSILALNWAREDHKGLKFLTGAFSLVISIVGVATLAEYAFGLNFGIDGLVFSGKMGPNVVRMSPQSTVNFMLVGLALFFYSWQGRKRVIWGQILILAAGITALVSLFGFIYGVSGLYTVAPYKGMAAHTAVAFFTTFLGILLLRPEMGFMRIFVSRNLSGMAARRLLLALFAILVIEIIVMTGGKSGIYDIAYESLIHLIIVTGVFVFLIYFSFRSLDRLAEAEKNIEHMREVDKAKTEFVSLASHQLRTPLTSISWFSEMLMRQEVGSLNPKQKEYLSEIFTQNRRMIDLVDDLLNSSRIDMGMLYVDPKPVDLRSILDSVLLELDPLSKEKEIRVDKNFSSDLPVVEADPELTRIIFQNIISNAIKYTPNRGKVGVDVARSGSYIDIKVADTGYGIPQKQQSKIFTKMFRADNIRNKVTDGSGLGLYIVKAIVRESGGKIYFDSKEGKGTTFFVTLPIRRHK